MLGAYPQSIERQHLLTRHWMNNSQIAFNTDNDKNQNGGSGAQAVDKMVHLAHKFSEDPAKNTEN